MGRNAGIDLLIGERMACGPLLVETVVRPTRVTNEVHTTALPTRNDQIPRMHKRASD